MVQQPRFATLAYWVRITALLAVLAGLGACSSAATSPPAGPSAQAAAPKATPIGGDCTSVSKAPANQGPDPVAAARNRVMVSYNAPSEWTGPTSAPKPQAGKRIAIISSAQLTEGSARAARGMVAAAQTMGWQPTIFDGKGDTGVMLQAINSAVDSKYDGIAMIFVNPDTVSEALNRAKAANIPVVTLGVAPYTASRGTTWGWIPDVSHDWIYTGEVIADYMIWKSNGNVDVYLLDGAETMIVHCGQTKGTFERLMVQGVCPNCQVHYQTFTYNQLENVAPQLAIAAVQADPKINWIWCYDFCMANVVKQMEASGVGQNVKGAGFDCNAENIALIKDRKIQVVCIADPRDWEAWATMDTLNRVMQGQPVVNQRIPVRLFDVDNASEFTATDAQQGWQGGFDYKTQYKAIWGVQ